MNFGNYREELFDNGFTVINEVFTPNEVESLKKIIRDTESTNSLFRRTADLFAIRQVLKEIPELTGHIFTTRLRRIITEVFGSNYFVTKSIFFDKPERSNWFVAYHQDLTISVDQKADVEGFGPWTVKQNQYAVQPTLDILEQNFTIRIHLDDTDAGNGALKVIPRSHQKGIYRPENIDWAVEKEATCNVKAGGIMIMKPLLLHASNRTINNNRRRVLHLEFSNAVLPEPLTWSEKFLW